VAETGGDATPGEPLFAGSQAEQLLGALERLRATFGWKADGLRADELQARLEASALTLGGPQHLALVEDHASTVELTGAPLGTPWSADPGARWLVGDLVEEHGRHTGDADLLREVVDGRVGEDPPPGRRAGTGWAGPQGWRRSTRQAPGSSSAAVVPAAAVRSTSRSCSREARPCQNSTSHARTR
jgi:hypothetical protein